MNNDTEATLHLPRLLCLHGGGTNARIFRLQCRMLEKRLGSTLRLVYADGPITGVQPGPDVTSVYKDYAPFRSWLPLEQLPDGEAAGDAAGHAGGWTAFDRTAAIDAALWQAMEEDDAKGATGAWVGLLGFSQGAKMAASILYRQQRWRGGVSGSSRFASSFRWAVLCAGRGPLVWLQPALPVPRGLVDAATPSTLPAPPPRRAHHDADSHLVRLPTIHVHGRLDPGLDSHRALLREHCHPQHATLVEWAGGHRMPIKTSDVDMVVQQILRVMQDTSQDANQDANQDASQDAMPW